MNLEKAAIIFVLVCGFLLCCIPITLYDIPLSWEGFYHTRIAQNFAASQYYDSGSFGPEGRIQVYPPVFHVISAFLIKVTSTDGFFLARWVPPFVFCALIFVWYYLISQLYSDNVALLSSLLLLAVPAFVDLGFLFSPHSLALILVFLAFLFLDKPVLSGVLGGMVIMTQFSAALFYFLVLALWFIFDSTKRKPVLKIAVTSLVIALPYLGYFAYYSPPFEFVLGNLGLQYFFMKTTFVVTALAVLGLKKDFFAASLGGAGFILSFLQPTNFCYLAFPLALFSAFFICDFFSHKKLAVVVFVLIFWLCLIPSQEYVSKLQPAASEYESFVWLKDNSVPSIVASGWYQAPVIASVSGRVPVLGFGFPEQKRVEDMAALYSGDKRLLDFYDISYVYFGSHEQYDYNKTPELDRVYSGKGAFYKREPPLIYVLLTVDVEPDLPPVLSSYKGVEEGLPLILNLLDQHNVCATFFVLEETAEVYPDTIAELALHHEVGCHSLYHEDLRTLSYQEKTERVEKATAILRKITGDVTSFRAPGHSCDTELLSILSQNGYSVEASACKQFFYPYRPSEENWLDKGTMDFLRVPISHTPSYFYAPLIYPRPWIECYLDVLEIQSNHRIKIIVIGLHPWEFVELEAPGYESYTKACGEYTRTEFEQLLEFLHKRRVTFLTMRQLYHMWEVVEEWSPV